MKTIKELRYALNEVYAYAHVGRLYQKSILHDALTELADKRAKLEKAVELFSRSALSSAYSAHHIDYAVAWEKDVIAWLKEIKEV